MKLRTLRIHGFKSFADRTEVQFHDGITAVVGPNGCGKSNISDAIRWVLGEQRPTAIRGARMEEAIFQGTVNRRPVNRGSVTIAVSNEDGALPVPFEEVEIARTVYRDGGSEYFLNRSACRLRDIHDLCRDTGLGANAYSIIESRMIDAILSDRAEERRALFEEASGIGKYKDRRKAALRRLERAELDLERVDDVIAEVQSKVRSLARQKGRAERYRDLRMRRLALDVTVATRELERLEGRLVEIRGGLEGGRQDGEGFRAELAAAEAEVETIRARRLEAERSRGETAGSLEGVRRELARWERELAVAAERGSAAARRLERLLEEREEARVRASLLSEESEAVAVRREAQEAELAALQERATEAQRRAAASRERLQGARAAADRVESRERELARRSAQLEGEAASLDAQAAELARRIEQLVRELAEAGEAASHLATQGDLFSSRVAGVEEGEAAARKGLDATRRGLDEAKARLEGTRVADREASDAAARLEAQRDALVALERNQEGVEPVLRAALALGDEGVLGTLADFLEATGERGDAVEAFLGPLLRALVVKDSAAVLRLGAWFREGWSGGGGLLVLPADRIPDPAGPLPEGVGAVGAGAGWVEALLGGVEWVEGLEALVQGTKGRAVRLLPSGGGVDARGVLRLGNPLGSSGVLERRRRLEELVASAAAARTAADEARVAREAEREAVAAREVEVESARGALREAEDRARAVRAEVQAQEERKLRADRLREDLVRQLEGTRIARERAVKRAAEARSERDVLQVEEQGLGEQRAATRSELEAAQEGWEEARGEEARLAVELARADGEVGRLRERAADLAVQGERGRERMAALDREEGELIRVREASEATRNEGAEATRLLFQERDEREALLRERDAELALAEEALGTAESRVRDSRNREREATDRKHRLELEEKELVGLRDRVVERLESEWGHPMARLQAEAEEVEGDPEELREELAGVISALVALGPVNMLAVEEHEEESTRLDFLSGQRDDLVKARDDLRTAIREINQTATARFATTFEQIRTNFKETFHRLFQGGECDLWLSDPEDPLESPIEVHASPVGKKTQRIDLLSGGERALTALSLLFGIYLVKPSPFCVLDEVDAPLDENNIGRFIRLLQEFKDGTQFVVITHNPRTIEAADWIYGVTMEEPGVSTIVGVKLEEALQAAGIA